MFLKMIKIVDFIVNFAKTLSLNKLKMFIFTTNATNIKDNNRYYVKTKAKIWMTLFYGHDVFYSNIEDELKSDSEFGFEKKMEMHFN